MGEILTKLSSSGFEEKSGFSARTYMNKIGGGGGSVYISTAFKLSFPHTHPSPVQTG